VLGLATFRGMISCSNDAYDCGEEPPSTTTEHDNAAAPRAALVKGKVSHVTGEIRGVQSALGAIQPRETMIQGRMQKADRDTL